MTLAEIKENNLRCAVKVDSKEEAVELFKIFNPNGYDANYAYYYLTDNYWKGDGTVCFGVTGNKIDGFDTETYYKKNEEQYGKIYRFKDLIAEEGIVGTFKGTPVYADGGYVPYSKIPTPSKPVPIEEQLGLPKGVSIYDLNPIEWYRPMEIRIDASDFDAEELAKRIKEKLSDNKIKFTREYKEVKPMKFTFYVKEGTRPDKKCNGLIPTMTTTVIDASGKKATVTCDKADYSERQGVLEAIAQIACGGNFDKEYNKAVKKNKLIELHDRTCTYCGKVCDTVEELKEHEAWHVERKKARRERYLLRKRAKEIAFEEQAQKMAKEMMGEK